MNTNSSNLEETILEIIKNTNSKNPEKIAFNSRISIFEKNISFSEIDKKSNRLAGYMQQKLKIKKQDTVAIMMPNIIQHPISMIATIKIGGIITNVNPLYTPRELEHQLKDSNAETIIIASPFIETLESIIKNTKIKNVIITDIPDCFSKLQFNILNFLLKYIKKSVPKCNIKDAVKFYDILNSYEEIDYNKVKIYGSDIAFLQYTGGTTGVSKGVVLTHKNITSNIEQCNYVCSPLIKESKEVILTALPLYHIFALTINFLYFYKKQSLNVLVVNPRDQNSLIEIIKKYKPTIITGVNTLFQVIIKNKKSKEIDFSNLKLTIGGGMSVEEQVSDKWKELTGKIIIEGYGLTECSPLVACNPTDLTDFNSSIGKSIANTEVKIVDLENEEVQDGKIGELLVKGPQVMSSYWNREEETKEALKDGWLRTGDICYRDKKGFLYIVDRKKDMINVSGFNVFPKEIENVLNLHKNIEESAVIGFKDKKSGESIRAFVKLKEGRQLDNEKIIAYCKKHLTSYKVPKDIKFIDEIPKSNVGKILKTELR